MNDPHVTSYQLLWQKESTYIPICYFDGTGAIVGWGCAQQDLGSGLSISHLFCTTLDCAVHSVINYNVNEQDGAKHALIEAANNDIVLRTYDGSQYLYVPSFNRSFDRFDGQTTVSGSTASANAGVVTSGPIGFGDYGSRAPGTIITSAGISYTYLPTPGSPQNSIASSEVIGDKNGNKITVAPYWTFANSESTAGIAVTDSVGRAFQSPPDPTSDTTGCPAITDPGNSVPTPPDSSSTWEVPGPNGTAKYLICYVNVPINTNFDFSAVDSAEKTKLLCPLT